MLVSLCQPQCLVLKTWHYTGVVVTEEFSCVLMTVSLEIKTGYLQVYFIYVTVCCLADSVLTRDILEFAVGKE